MTYKRCPKLAVDKEDGGWHTVLKLKSLTNTYCDSCLYGYLAFTSTASILDSSVLGYHESLLALYAFRRSKIPGCVGV